MNCHVNEISWPLLEGYMIQAILISWCCSGLPLPHLAQDATALHPRTEDLAPWEASASSGWWLSPQEKGESQSCFIPKIRVNYLGIIIYPSSCPFQPNIQVLIWLIDLYIYINCKRLNMQKKVETTNQEAGWGPCGRYQLPPASHHRPNLAEKPGKNMEKPWNTYWFPCLLKLVATD